MKNAPNLSKERSSETGLVRKYADRLEEAKRRYEAAIAEDMTHLAQIPQEGHKFYASGLTGTHAENGMPTGYFDSNALHSFAGLPAFDGGQYTDKSVKKEIAKFRSSDQGKGKKVLAFDPFGQGRVGVGIADETIAATLTPNPEPISGVTEFNGDSLSEEVSNKIFSHIRQRIDEGYALRMTFFRPVLGMQSYDRNLYVLHTLYERLRSIYEMTDEGGLIFIQSAGSGTDISFLDSILSGDRYKDVRSPTEQPEKPRMVLRKSAEVASLPSLLEIAQNHPDIMRSLLRMDEQSE